MENRFPWEMEACACFWTQQAKRLELKAPPLAAPSATSPLPRQEHRQSQAGQGHVGTRPGDGHMAQQDLPQAVRRLCTIRQNRLLLGGTPSYTPTTTYSSSSGHATWGHTGAVESESRAQPSKWTGFSETRFLSSEMQLGRPALKAVVGIKCGHSHTCL